jgi:glycosyltransferase involved in cell wall biosynthesis
MQLKTNSKSIICSHLLNNYSGSPFVLSHAVTVLSNNNYKVKLYIGNKKGKGFLTGLKAAYTYSFYTFKQNKLLRLLYLFGAQLSIFLKLVFSANKNNCQFIYANTLYSFGAALAGKLKGIKVIYHIHETYISPYPLKWFLQKMVQLTASKTIFVSKNHESLGKISNVPSKIIYNCIDPKLYQKSKEFSFLPKYDNEFNVSMIASLKAFKGISEFLLLVATLVNHSNIKFHLLLNCSELEYTDFARENAKFSNLTIHARTNDVSKLLQKSNLVLNLTQPDKAIETFGLTLLEAMTFGIPVIAPPIGGPTELVDDGVNGYLISCYEIESIAQKITALSQNSELLLYLSKNAKEKAAEFSPAKFESQLLQLFNE